MEEHYDCLYCYNRVTAQGDDHLCPSCGMPLPRQPASSRKKKTQRLFVIGFIILVVICLFIIVWLPR